MSIIIVYLGVLPLILQGSRWTSLWDWIFAALVVCFVTITVEAIREIGPFGWIKHKEIVLPKTPYSFTLPPGILRRDVLVMSADEIRIWDVAINGGSSRITYLNKEHINKANLTVPGKNGPIHLKWKK